MNTAELCYIAGLFDGEGHCRIVKYRATKNGALYYRAQVAIANTDRRCLDYVKKCLGFGWVGINNYKTVTELGNPRKICYKYGLVNMSAIRFLELIRPFVHVKAEQIDGVLNNKHNGRVI